VGEARRPRHPAPLRPGPLLRARTSPATSDSPARIAYAATISEGASRARRTSSKQMFAAQTGPEYPTGRPGPQS
jgi:hypothetical protein